MLNAPDLKRPAATCGGVSRETDGSATMRAFLDDAYASVQKKVEAITKVRRGSLRSVVAALERFLSFLLPVASSWMSLQNLLFKIILTALCSMEAHTFLT